MSRGKSKASLALIDAMREILREIQPASVRAVCYRLFTMGLIPNMSKNSTNKVGTQLKHARETGAIPWGWVVDETREAELPGTWTDPDEIIDAAVTRYRKDYWRHQPRTVEVWSEKGTIRGSINPVLKDLGVPLRVMHGYGSATAVNEIAEDSARSTKPMTALYVGDFDPSGLHMSEVDLPGRLGRYGGRVDVRRIALVPDDLHGLPSFDAETKAGDSRHRWFTANYGQTCWELDALSPVILRERVRSAIVDLIEADAWNAAIATEAAEIESMREFHAAWSKSMRAPICSGGAS